MDILSMSDPSSEDMATTVSLNYSQYITETYESWNHSSFHQQGSNYTTKGMHVMRDTERDRIIIIAVIMAFTLIGNMTLILVLLWKRSRRIKRVNILLVNLAIGDLAVALFVNSTEIFFVAFGDWTLGPLMCKVSVYVQMICLSSTTNLLTAMSIDRYQVIVKPMQSLAKRPRIWLKIAIAWIISLILPLPQLFIFLQYNEGVKYDGSPKRICGSKGYTAQWQRKAYVTFTTFYIIVIPVIIMIYCYFNIIRVVWVRAKNESHGRPNCLIPPRPPATTPKPATPPIQISESYEKKGARCHFDDDQIRTRPVVHWSRIVKEKKDSNENASNRKKVMEFSDDLHPGSPRMSVRRSLVTASKRRALMMTLGVIISFLVCQLPYFIITLIRIYSDYQVKLELIKIISEFLVMVHSTLNPILYGLFTLRQYHLKYFLSILTCSQRSSPVQGTRHGQSSFDERHQLLKSVRDKLTLRSNTGAMTFTGKSGLKRNPRQEQHPNQLASTTAVTVVSAGLSQTTPSSISILKKFRFKKLPIYSKKKKSHWKGKQHKDTLLFANSDAINLKNKYKIKSIDTEPSDEDISDGPHDVAIGGSFITNTHIVGMQDSLYSSPKDGVTNRGRRVWRKLSGGCDRELDSRISCGDDPDLSRDNKAIPWTPEDDEFMIGGLTRV